MEQIFRYLLTICISVLEKNVFSDLRLILSLIVSISFFFLFAIELYEF